MSEKLWTFTVSILLYVFFLLPMIFWYNICDCIVNIWTELRQEAKNMRGDWKAAYGKKTLD